MASFSASCNSLRRDGRTVYVNVYCSASSGYYGRVLVNGSQKSTWTNANGGSYSGTTTLSWDCPGAFSSRSIECRFQYYDSRGGRTQNSYQYPATGSLGAMTITATFDENYEGGGTSTETETYDSVWVLPADPVRNGYNFLGWFDDPDAGNQILATDICQKDANITIYAHWERAGFNIYRDLNGVVGQVAEIYRVSNGTVEQVTEVYRVNSGTVEQV